MSVWLFCLHWILTDSFHTIPNKFNQTDQRTRVCVNQPSCSGCSEHVWAHTPSLSVPAVVSHAFIHSLHKYLCRWFVLPGGATAAVKRSLPVIRSCFISVIIFDYDYDEPFFLTMPLFCGGVPQISLKLTVMLLCHLTKGMTDKGKRNNGSATSSYQMLLNYRWEWFKKML